MDKNKKEARQEKTSADKSITQNNVFSKKKITIYIIILLLCSIPLLWQSADKCDSIVATESKQPKERVEYNFVSSYEDGLSRVISNNKTGFIDKSGNIIIPLKYNTAWDIKEGIIVAKIKFSRIQPTFKNH